MKHIAIRYNKVDGSIKNIERHEVTPKELAQKIIDYNSNKENTEFHYGHPTESQLQVLPFLLDKIGNLEKELATKDALSDDDDLRESLSEIEDICRRHR